MQKLPRSFAPLLFGIIQSALTTGIASAIATPHPDGLNTVFLSHWAVAWGMAWLAMLPVVAFASPFIRRAVDQLIEPE